MTSERICDKGEHCRKARDRHNNCVDTSSSNEQRPDTPVRNRFRGDIDFEQNYLLNFLLPVFGNFLYERYLPGKEFDNSHAA